MRHDWPCAARCSCEDPCRHDSHIRKLAITPPTWKAEDKNLLSILWCMSQICSSVHTIMHAANAKKLYPEMPGAKLYWSRFTCRVRTRREISGAPGKKMSIALASPPLVCCDDARWQTRVSSNS